MSQEIKTSEIQDNSIDTFRNLVKIVKEHPLGAIIIILGLLFSNIFQWYRGKKSKNVTKKLNLCRKTHYKSKIHKFENAGIQQMKIDI